MLIRTIFSCVLRIFPFMLVVSIVACGSVDARVEKRTSAFSGSTFVPMPLGTFPPTAKEQLADWERLRTQPYPLVAERAGGQPLIYYGRIFARTRGEAAVMRLFGFVTDRAPFFDEYGWSKGEPLGYAPGLPGGWRYAIGSGAQWNLLAKWKLVSAIEINPRWDKHRAVKTPHPAMDTFVRADGSLDPQKLVDAQFFWSLPDLHSQSGTCQEPNSSSLHAKWWGSDLVDDVISTAEGVGGDVLSGLSDILRAAGGTLSDVLKAAYGGAKEAIDALSKLGNWGVCQFTGTFTHAGRIYALDPEYTAGDPSTPTRRLSKLYPVPGLPSEEPLRGARVFARGGPLGILMTDAEVGPDGSFKFDNMCQTIGYRVKVELSSDFAWITDIGLDATAVQVSSGDSDVFEGMPNKDNTEWESDDAALVAYVAIQHAFDIAASEYKFVPQRVRVSIGTVADIVTFSGSSSTLCGAADLISGALILVAPPAAALTSVMLSQDIYFHGTSLQPKRPDALRTKNVAGVVTHEYGHFLECEAMRHAGRLDGFLDAYIAAVLSTMSNDKMLEREIRNSAEALADHFSYHARGYTDYFVNACSTAATGARAGVRCSGPDAAGLSANCVSPLRDCLEPDAVFTPANVNVATKPINRTISAKASSTYDWLDQPALTELERDSPLRLPPAAFEEAVSHASFEPNQYRMAAYLADNAAWGKPAPEVFCSIFKRHGLGCDGLAAKGLRAPVDFQGVALDENRILWSWVPDDSLADKYVLVRPNTSGSGFDDVTTVADPGSDVVEIVGGPNRPATRAVESRGPSSIIYGAPKAGRSERITRCTLAAAVPAPLLKASVTPDAVKLEWRNVAASKYRIRRKPAGAKASPTVVGEIVAPPFIGDPVSYFDGTAPPGATYEYTVDSLNCDGLPTSGPTVTSSASTSDDGFLFVRAGAVGGDGSRAKPFGTISDAMPATRPDKSIVLITGGEYTERVAHYGGFRIRLYGGYTNDFTSRDPVANATVIDGDDSDWTIDTGTEYGMKGRPKVYLAGGAFLDGIDFGNYCSCSGITCVPVCVHQQLVASARDVELHGVKFVAPRLAAAPKVDKRTLPAISCGTKCSVYDSTLDESKAPSEWTLVYGDQVVVQDSTIISSSPQTAVVGSEVAIDRSVVRSALWAKGAITTWEPVSKPFSSGVPLPEQRSVAVNAGCLSITNSVIAGSWSVVESAHATLCPTNRRSAAGNVLFGEALLRTTNLLNNVIIATNQLLAYQPPPLPSSDPVPVKLRNNLMIQLGGGVWLQVEGNPAGTAASVNDAVSLFGAAGAHNDFAGNQTATSLEPFFDTSGDEANPMNLGHPFHPRRLPALGLGASPSIVGLSLMHDLDGVARHEVPHTIGAYDF